MPDDDPDKDYSAAVAIYGLEKQQAEKQFRNNERNKRKAELLRSKGGFRIPEQLKWKDRNILQATHGGEVHQVDRDRGIQAGGSSHQRYASQVAILSTRWWLCHKMLEMSCCSRGIKRLGV